MASIRLKFRPSTIRDREGFLIYQIIHKRQTRHLKTSYQLFSSEWDNVSDHIVLPKEIKRREHVMLIRDKINWELDRIYDIIKKLEFSGIDYSVNDIILRFQSMKPVESVFCFMKRRISTLLLQNRTRTATGYIASMNSFMNFRNGADLSFDAFDSDLMELYEAYLRHKGLVKNSSSFYMRIWRTVYRLAIEKGETKDRDPFKHVYTGIDRTTKRAISFQMIKALKMLDLSLEPKLELARDIFMFSFYTRGMSFIDMAYLRTNNLKYGMLSYVRRKTGQKLTIFVEPLLDQLIKKYSGHTYANYLLPIFKEPDKDETKQLRERYKQIGRALKKLAVRVNLNIPLTLYVARHSWASIAKEKNIPISVIKDGLGHNSEKTTEIYLASINTSLVDEANHRILENM